jgi:transposase-like protein
LRIADTTVDFLLTAKRDRKAALRFLRKAIKWNGMPENCWRGVAPSNPIKGPLSPANLK